MSRTLIMQQQLPQGLGQLHFLQYEQGSIWTDQIFSLQRGSCVVELIIGTGLHISAKYGNGYLDARDQPWVRWGFHSPHKLDEWDRIDMECAYTGGPCVSWDQMVEIPHFVIDDPWRHLNQKLAWLEERVASELSERARFS